MISWHHPSQKYALQQRAAQVWQGGHSNPAVGPRSLCAASPGSERTNAALKVSEDTQATLV
eukprot:1535427-Amphidinium_carterae.1